MNPVYYLEWSYKPKNYFEEPLHFERDGCRIKIHLGKVKAILGEQHKNRLALFDEIHQHIEDYFHAIQIVTHKGYALTSYSLYEEFFDGRKSITVFPASVSYRIAGGSADIKVIRADGTVVFDTKAERINEKKLLMKLIPKYRSSSMVVAAMLHSYSLSVKDPKNELVHLYEIRESLCVQFGGQKKVEAELGITAVEWSDFGKLANWKPVTEGRHRGKDQGNLRKSTNEELAGARNFAKKLILEYLTFLERSGI